MSGTAKNGLDPRLAGAMLGAISDGVFAVDRDFRITFFNTAAERITGCAAEDALGRACADVLRSSACGADCPLRRTTPSPAVGHEVEIIDQAGRPRTVRVTAVPLFDAGGAFAAGIEAFTDVSSLQALRREIRGRQTTSDLVARSASMRRLAEALPNVARSGAPVLLEGKVGTGKELVAAIIHHLSQRSGAALVKYSCAAVPESLIALDLFGGEGAASPGRLAAARGGTLFIDDVADLPLGVQARLARLLETEGAALDVRLVAATREDLLARVQGGLFRDDLFYRLKVVALRLPTLRERPEDLPGLIEQTLERLCRRAGRPPLEVAPAAMAVLLDYDYPGNVRELENLLEHACIVTRGGRIELGDLPAQLRAAVAGGTPEASERAVLRAALEQAFWSVPRAAANLGIHRTTLWRKLKRLGLTRP